MKRSSWDGRTLVYRYAAPARWDGENVDLGEPAQDQLRLAHELRNVFVELWRAHEDAKAALWLTRMEVAELAAHVEDAERAADNVRARIGAARVSARDRTADGGLSEQLRDIRGRLKVLRSEHKNVKRLAAAGLKAQFGVLLADYRAAKKALYGDFVQDRGLYWGTFNAVVAAMEVAAGRVTAARTSGRPAQLRFARWTGEGRLVVQLQRQAGDPPRTPEAIVSGTSKWRNSLRIVPAPVPGNARPGQRVDRMRIVMVKVGADGRQPVWQHVPVVWHRELPPDGEVTDVKLVRRRTAGTYRLAVCFTVRLPPPPVPERSSVCGVDVGWRAMPDGSIRVAAWHGTPTTPFAVPASFAAAVTVGPDSGEVRIPGSWVDGPWRNWRKIDDLASIRGKNLEALRADLLTRWEAAPGLADLTGASRADLARWRSPARFAGLAHRLATADGIATENGVPDLMTVLQEWRHHDRHLWEWQAHQTAALTRRRRHLYRLVAALLVGAFGEVVVEEAFAGTVRRKPDRDEVDDWQAERARWQARIAAPAELAAALTAAGSRDGVPVRRADPAYTSRAHHGCGGMFDPEELRDRVTVRCPACGEQVDQDVNAARNLAAAT